MEACELCDQTKPLTKHHLIPRAVHSKKRYRARYGKQEMIQRAIKICRQCHNGIHDLIPNQKELADLYHTKELLLSHAGVARHVAWARKQK